MVCKHEQNFYLPEGRPQNRVLVVLVITFITMMLEISAGYLFNSVALLADGIHMVTHIIAFSIAYLAYYFARKLAREGSFTFGTWKVEVLGAYTSSILLFFASFLLLQESATKLIRGTQPQYEEALMVALVGLIVNLFSAYLLHEREYHHDMNLKSAYFHALSDGITSLLAIGGLITGKFFGLWFMDPFMGLVGFFLILKWSFGLMKETVPVLLDREGKNPLAEQIVKSIERDGKSKVYDIHLLRVYHDKYVCILGLETQEDYNLEYYQRLISNFEQVIHATIELRHCTSQG